MVGLGDLPGGFFHSEALGVSADGSVIVGHGQSVRGLEATIWDETNGMRSLFDILSDDLGLDLLGWELQVATSISADGLTIAGSGINPDGNREAWVARLDPTTNTPEPASTPEPAISLALLSIGSLAAKTLSRRTGFT